MSGTDNILAKFLLEAIEEENFKIAKILLENFNASPNVLVKGRGIAAMHYASGMENVEFGEKIIEIMLEHHGDPNVKTEDNITPMHVATIWGRVNIVKMLLNKGGDVDFPDNENKTPLLYAIYECQFEIFEIFRHYYFAKKLNDKNKKVGSANTVKIQRTGQEFDKGVGKLKLGAGNCNYNDASPHYINLEKKRKQVQEKKQGTESVDDGNSYEEKNLFELTEENLTEYSNNVSPDRSKASFIKQWREKVQRSKTKSSLVNKFNDIDSLLSGIMTEESVDFTNTIFTANGEEELERKRPQKFDMTGFGKLLQKLREEARTAELDEAEQTFQTAINDSNFIRSPKRFAEVAQMAEGYVHQDPENGLVFYEKKLLAATETDTATNKSSDNETDFTIPVDYDTDALRAELTNFGEAPGPITKSTKRLYTKRLIKYKRNIEDMKVREIPESNFSIELRRTIRSKDWFIRIPEFLALETKMCNNFQDTNLVKKKFREGNLKTSFIYLLIDPRISMNLPGESVFLEKHEVWKRFLNSIFYVGKGKSSRPYSHLYDAIKEFNWRNEKKIRSQMNIQGLKTSFKDSNANTLTPIKSPKKAQFPVKSPLKYSNSNKIKRILEIWENERGVVCLHIFHNILPAEAYTREAAMIDALSLQHLTNLKTGNYYGCTQTWSMREKKNMGVILLYKALQIFLIEGESQLLPCDIIADT